MSAADPPGVSGRETDETMARRCRLAYELWTSLWTAVTMSCLRSHGQGAIAELEFRSLRRHQVKHFLAGIAKLGLADEPSDVVRCGRYHYFSNSLGGLPMEYVEELPDRVWVRYRPPFWIGDGVTLPSAGPAALGSAFGTAAFRGWHGNNGALLGNPRLAFVQTQNLADGDPWDAGYFCEVDRDLPPGEAHLRSPGEWGPRFDPDAAPVLPSADWPEARRWRALRNYAVDHTATRFTILSEMFGTLGAAHVVEHGFRMVLAQRWETLASSVGVDGVTSPADAARFVAAVRSLIDDDGVVETRSDGTAIARFESSRMWRDEEVALADIDHAIARAWSATLPLHHRDLRCRLRACRSAGDDADEWIFETGAA